VDFGLRGRTVSLVIIISFQSRDSFLQLINIFAQLTVFERSEVGDMVCDIRVLESVNDVDGVYLLDASFIDQVHEIHLAEILVVFGLDVRLWTV